ncbi:MAG: glycosyltransferase family 2 protein [Symbiobacteriia bacterium]
MPQRWLAVVPAYNEAASIGGVVAEIREALPGFDVLVVSDGSADETAAIARTAGAMVVELPQNLGIGGAVQTGYLYAARHGYAGVVQIDGDGQHDPRELPRLKALVDSGAADLAVGSRYLADTGYEAVWARRFGSWLLAALVEVVIGQRVTDPTSGFRAAGPRAVALFAREYPVDYPEVETLVLLWRSGLRIAELPVSMRARGGGRSSITAWKSIDYMIKVSLAVLVQGLRQRGVG